MTLVHDGRDLRSGPFSRAVLVGVGIERPVGGLEASAPTLANTSSKPLTSLVSRLRAGNRTLASKDGFENSLFPSGALIGIVEEPMNVVAVSTSATSLVGNHPSTSAPRH